MLIGLHGYKGVGKNAVGDYLAMNHDFRQLAFANKLKEAVANLFDISVEDVDKWKYEEPPLPASDVKPLGFVEILVDIGGDIEHSYAWREFLQRFGTEMGRNTFGQDFWVLQLARTYHGSDSLPGLGSAPPPDTVITDVRFENEARWIHKQQDSYLIEITRPGYESDGHASEVRIDEELIDCLVTNTGTIEDLHKDIEGVLSDIRYGETEIHQ